ncbi:MAG TPA: VWA domain-containing protein [Vicinamibacterales bacterium]|nr:VWA domain-containing protein [Vicinamibacterales bacterium]
MDSRRPLTPAAIVAGIVLAGAGVPGFQADQRPVFRTTAALVAVDVQVVDRSGQPVAGLKPEDFTVELNGRRRRVVSAEMFHHSAGVAGAAGRDPAAAPGAVPGAPEGRNIILAIDESSFRTLNALAAVQAVKRFVGRLNPADLVGLYTYPVHGPEFVLTTDHAAVLEDLSHVVGTLHLPRSEYGLTVSEIADVTAGDRDVLMSIARRVCPNNPSSCNTPIRDEAQSLALAFEGQVSQSVSGLRTLLTALRGYDGRKILVLVSAGLLATDRVGARPDVASLVDYIGRDAAAANTTLYVLHMDSSFIDAFSPQGGRVSASFMRDAAALGAGLERFAGIAGGTLLRVSAGTGDDMFDRVLRETSAYYLLGVEPEEEDRDGRPHRISVSVRGRGLEVQSRAFVVIPERGGLDRERLTVLLAAASAR